MYGKVAQHYAATGNVAALAAIGAFDRNGATLASKYGPQWDAWTKQAKAVADGEAKKAVANSVDGLEARAMRGNEKPEDFNRDVDAARAKDPENLERLALRAKRTFASNLAQLQKQAPQPQAQQEAAAEREFIEQGGRALLNGHGYVLPSETRFTAADGKERLYTRKDYQERMHNAPRRSLSPRWASRWTPTTAPPRRSTSERGWAPAYKRSFDDLFAGLVVHASAAPEQLQQRLAQRVPPATRPAAPTWWTATNTSYDAGCVPCVGTS